MINRFEIKVLKSDTNSIYFDFFIDDKPLPDLLNINRLDMIYSNFDLDIINVDKTQFPNYNSETNNRRAVSCFLGTKAPTNQFGTNRLVLYRCHCGSDYCGVISLELQITEHTVIWKDIKYESDTVEEGKAIMKERNILLVESLTFNKKAYKLEFEKYLKYHFG